MVARDEKLSSDLGEAADLAVAEHLDTLKMKLPEQELSDGTPNPLFVKVKAFKNRAASDILAIMSRVDPQSMKGRKTDRTKMVLDRIMGWSSDKPQTKQ